MSSIMNPFITVPFPTGNASADRSNIQSSINKAAENGGGNVILQKGVYFLESHTFGSYTCCLFVPAGIRLIGAGMTSTVLAAVNSDCHVIMTDPAIWNGSFYETRNAIRMEDFQVLGGINSGSYTGIYLNGVMCCYMKNVWVIGNYAAGYHFNRGIHLKGWVGTLMNCNVNDCYQGFNLSWDDDLGSGPIDNTNAIAMIGCHFEGGFVPPPVGGSIGCYINGYANHISGSTIERRFTETTSTENQTAVYVKEDAGNSFTGCYFEGWRSNFTFDGCSGTTVTGGFMSSTSGIDAVQYLNGADSVEKSNVIQNMYEMVLEWDHGNVIQVSAGMRNTDNVKTIDVVTATPDAPTTPDKGRIYIKGDNLVIQYKDGTDIRYKWLSLTGVGVTWQQSTVAP